MPYRSGDSASKVLVDYKSDQEAFRGETVENQFADDVFFCLIFFVSVYFTAKCVYRFAFCIEISHTQADRNYGPTTDHNEKICADVSLLFKFSIFVSTQRSFVCVN